MSKKPQLPAKSDSKKIQKRHVRRVMTNEGPKDILINPGVRKNELRPRTPSPRDVVRRPASDLRPKTPSIPGKPQLRPKAFRIRNPVDLWNELRNDTKWFDEHVGFYNNNKELLQSVLFDEFKSELDSTTSQKEALDNFKKNFEPWVLEDYFGSGYSMRYTTWDENSDEKLEDIIGTDIDDEGAFELFHDPFEGKLFKPDLEQTLDWDTDKWKRFDMGGAGGFAENIIHDPDDFDNPGITRDSEFLNKLLGAGVPFIHMMHGQPYRNPDTDFILVPDKFYERAKELTK